MSTKHPHLGPDIDAVTALLREVADSEVLPRFRRLASSDVERKVTTFDEHDVVTVVDRGVERILTEALGELVPGSTVVGEESAHADGDVVRRLMGEQPVWVLDPIDGTHNFVAGRDGFGTMLAYVLGGETLASWVLLPARGECFVAERGSGATLNGARLTTQPLTDGRAPSGTLHTRYMPRVLCDHAVAAAQGAHQPEPDERASAVEYTEVARGRRGFVVYYRLLPWDHTAPALVVSEAGGCVEHLDGRPYGPRSTDQVTIVASDGATADIVRRWFPAGVAPMPAEPSR